MIKIIGIGNILMEDDGIGVIIAEKIRRRIENENRRDMQVIIGETDIDYSISFIEEGDCVFLIDGSAYNKMPGQLTVLTKQNCCYKKHSYTLHSYNLADLIKSYFKSVKVYIIGIEVSSVSFKLGLSELLDKKIESIYREVWIQIVSLVSKDMEA